MEIREISIQEVEHIYKRYMVKDFPTEELKPLSILKNLIQNGFSHCYGLFSSDVLKAYAFLYESPSNSVMLIDYYGVIDTERNRGYGSSFLRLLSKKCKEYSGILVEVEKIEKAKNSQDRQTRERRIRFYLNNGMIKTRVTSNLFGVDYNILYLPLKEKYDDKLVYAELDHIYRSMIDHKLHDKNVMIHLS